MDVWQIALLSGLQSESKILTQIIKTLRLGTILGGVVRNHSALVAHALSKTSLPNPLSNSQPFTLLHSHTLTARTYANN
jgi:hypothetical protein